MQLGEGELGDPVDGDDEVQLALSGSDLGDVDMDITGRMAGEALAGRLVAIPLRQPRQAVALQRAMQGRARQLRQARLQGGQAVVQRQQRVTAEGDDNRLVLG